MKCLTKPSLKFSCFPVLSFSIEKEVTGLFRGELYSYNEDYSLGGILISSFDNIFKKAEFH